MHLYYNKLNLLKLINNKPSIQFKVGVELVFIGYFFVINQHKLRNKKITPGKINRKPLNS